MSNILDEIAGAIGFTATLKLSAWHGDTKLYVPLEFSPGHHLCKLLGEIAYKKLVENYGGDRLDIGGLNLYEIEARNKAVGDLLCQDVSTKDIAERTGLSLRRVQQIRVRLQAQGVIPLDFPRKPTCV